MPSGMQPAAAAHRGTRRRYAPELILVTCGALLPLAFAPHGWWPAAIVLCAPLPVLWTGCSARRAALRGWLFGIAMLGTGLYWVQISIRLYGGLPGTLAWLLMLSLSALLALCAALAALLYHRATGGGRPTPAILLLAFPSAWTLGEWVRSWFLGGFPWLSLAYSQVPSPAGAYLPLFGIYGAGWLTAAASGALAGAWLYRGQLRRMRVGLALVALAWLAGLYRVEWTERLPGEVRTALIQGAVPQQHGWNAQYLETAIRRYTRLSAPHWRQDLVIWPEAVLPAFLDELDPLWDALGAAAAGRLLVGALERREGRTYNSLARIGPAAEPPYRKRRLVPFGEFNPPGLRPIMEALGLRLDDMAPGPAGSALLHPGGIAIGASICYDILFGEELAAASRDSVLLVNVSNDVWFGDSWGPHQHLQIAAARAMENGRYLLRATNSGISAVIDRRGRVLRHTAQFRPEVLAAAVPRYHGATPYARWGDLPAVLFSVLALAGLYVRRRHGTPRGRAVRCPATPRRQGPGCGQ